MHFRAIAALIRLASRAIWRSIPVYGVALDLGHRPARRFAQTIAREVPHDGAQNWGVQGIDQPRRQSTLRNPNRHDRNAKQLAGNLWGSGRRGVRRMLWRSTRSVPRAGQNESVFDY